MLFLCSAFDKGSISDCQSFLFTLVNPSGSQPIKLTPKPGAAIRCMVGVGPTFGNSAGYFDLTVWGGNDGGCSYRVSRLALGNGFTCPENVNRNTYFTGVAPFVVSELEVYQVNH